MDSSKTGVDMDISKKISIDIMKYLQEQKGMSIDDIAESMSTSPEFIQFVIEGKLKLTSNHINSYTQKNNLRFWEFAIKSIPMSHISSKAKKRIQLCKEISDHIKKSNKK